MQIVVASSSVCSSSPLQSFINPSAKSQFASPASRWFEVSAQVPASHFARIPQQVRKGPQPQPWLIRDSGQAACGLIVREKREGLDSPSSTFFLCFGSRIAQSCFALFFRFFSFWPQQNTFHVYLLLFFLRSCFSALFLCGATQAFLLFSKNPSIALFAAVHSELVGRKSNHRLSFACLLLERFRVLFSANGRSVEKTPRERERERQNSKNITHIRSLYSLSHYQKEFTHIFCHRLSGFMRQ